MSAQKSEINKTQIDYITGWLFGCDYEKKFQELRSRIQTRIANSGFNKATLDKVNQIMTAEAEIHGYKFEAFTQPLDHH